MPFDIFYCDSGLLDQHLRSSLASGTWNVQSSKIQLETAALAGRYNKDERALGLHF